MLTYNRTAIREKQRRCGETTRHKGFDNVNNLPEQSEGNRQADVALMRLRLAISICLLVMTLSLLAWLSTVRPHSTTSSEPTPRRLGFVDGSWGDFTCRPRPTRAHAHATDAAKGPDRLRSLASWADGMNSPDDTFLRRSRIVQPLSRTRPAREYRRHHTLLNSSGIPILRQNISPPAMEIRSPGTLRKIILSDRIGSTISVAANNQIQAYVTSSMCRRFR
jgi:hypothetical protein